MSKTGKSSSGTPLSPEDLPFEEALKKLEAVVEEMETDDLPLERLLTCFEAGSQLVRHCQSKLAEAELKIQQLEKNAAGGLELKPFDTPTAEGP